MGDGVSMYVGHLYKYTINICVYFNYQSGTFIDHIKIKFEQ